MSDIAKPSLAFLRAKVLSMSPEEYQRFREAFLSTQRAEAIARDHLRERERLLAKYGEKPHE